MHGCSSGSTLLVNAELDSMGGVVDSGVSIGLKTSPHRAAIEKAQADLRQEYDIREERRRELEFLEKGGNPLDFKFNSATSVSVQSTSVTDQHPDNFVTSEAKVNFASTASPYGDSVESSGRPGVPLVCEPNSADNLLLFDGDNELLEGDRKPRRPNARNSISQLERSSQLDGNQNAKEAEDSAIVRPYARRNRSRSNRDGARSVSTDIVQSHGIQASCSPAPGVLRDSKGLMYKTNNQQDQNIFSDSKMKSASSNCDVILTTSTSDVDMDSDDFRASKLTTCAIKDGPPESKMDNSASKSSRDDQHTQSHQITAQQVLMEVASKKFNLDRDREKLAPEVIEPPLCLVTTKPENETSSTQLNRYNDMMRDSRMHNEGQNGNLPLGTKGLDSESSCTSLDVNVNIDIDRHPTRYVNSHRSAGDQTFGFRQMPNTTVDEMGKENDEIKTSAAGAVVHDGQNSVYQNHSANGTVIKDEIDVANQKKDETDALKNRSEHNEVVNGNSSVVAVHQNDDIKSVTDMKIDNMLVAETTLFAMDSAATSDSHTCPSNDLKLSDKAHEDSILDEARIIKAKRKRIAELSIRTLPLENRPKSQWDFVLEEMAWLANDFAQERLWKISAAAQVCRGVAFTYSLRFQRQNHLWKLKEVAHTLAKAVMKFWHSAEVLLDTNDPGLSPENQKYNLAELKIDNVNEVSQNMIGEPLLDTGEELKLSHKMRNVSLGVQNYAVRFLKYNSSPSPQYAEAPKTPDRISDPGILEMPGEDHSMEGLFYMIPLGAMGIYRKSIEFHFVQCDKVANNSTQEEVETSMYDAVSEFRYQNPCDEDEADTSTHYLPGAFEGSKSSKFYQKKWKNSVKSFAGRSYEGGTDLPYGHLATGTQQAMLMGKRPASLNVGSIPTKRMRTAPRQRVISPFNSGAAVVIQAQAKTDASSGDTNSFQDDQSTLHGGFQMQRSVEVESVGEFEKQVRYETVETSIKSKKKKKAKHLGSAYDHGWQLDSTVANEQRDSSKKRLENHHFESNGTSGLYGQPNIKKPKIMKHQLDSTFDSINPTSGSIPSPVASQMSNMCNTNRFIKLIGGRDKGRKAKALKTSAGQSGSGSPWSLFEDQALVVLVHDMGPNWELVSDAINSTLQFKCIFRKPKECKERHKTLMDKGAGDGADSAEDSGSSQPYPSTLPGIPKGSARQLFQRLQEPMEEDTLKSHFERIIKIGQKQYSRRSQNGNQDPKQIVAVHNSHIGALSQVCPNNLNGGVLTPLDLIDATSSPDFPVGYQSPTSGSNSSLQLAMVLDGNLSPLSGSLNASRDGRYNVPRVSPLPVDEQQRMHQYNQMVSGRNFQQSNLSATGKLPGSERSVRMLPGGAGMMCGVNRSTPISRPGLQGMASSNVLPSAVNMHSGAGSGQGNSMLRTHEPLHMMRPGHNPEHQRQMMIPELPLQVQQGSNQCVPPFNGINSAFSNQTSTSIHAYPGHPQRQHQMSPQQPHSINTPHHPHLQAPNHSTISPQQGYPIRLPKERQLQQQRYLQQQPLPQVFVASNALGPNVQSQSQPLSSSLQSSPQLPPQTSSQPLPGSPLTPSPPMTPMSSQHQHKHHLPPHGLSRNSGVSGLNNQLGKQRQRQPQMQQQFQQPPRHHPQQRQQTQSQQHAKLSKGIGRGNMLVHQHLSLDPHVNGLSLPQGIQASEKGEQVMQLIQGQGLYSGSGLNTIQHTKPMVLQSSTHSQVQQKLLSGAVPSSSKQVHQIPSHSDNSTQSNLPPQVPPGHTITSQKNMLAASHQVVPPVSINQQQLQSQPQPSQKQANQTQSSIQRILQNRQANSDPFSKAQSDQAQSDQQPVNNQSQVGTTVTMPQSCANSVDVAPASQWRSSEAVYDSNVPCSSNQASSIASPSLPKSSGSEPLPIGQVRQLSGGLHSHGLNVGSQWQQQMSLQQSTSQPPPSQNQEQAQGHQSPQHHLPLQQKSQ